MGLKYDVSKEKGSSRYYVHETGKPQHPIGVPYKDNKKAIHAAAEMEGMDYKTYMRERRKKTD